MAISSIKPLKLIKMITGLAIMKTLAKIIYFSAINVLNDFNIKFHIHAKRVVVKHKYFVHDTLNPFLCVCVL